MSEHEHLWPVTFQSIRVQDTMQDTSLCDVGHPIARMCRLRSACGLTCEMLQTLLAHMLAYSSNSQLPHTGGQTNAGIKKALTLCSVDREGLTSGFDIVIIARVRRAEVLVMSSCDI